jgi:hypothetical protein
MCSSGVFKPLGIVFVLVFDVEGFVGNMFIVFISLC